MKVLKAVFVFILVFMLFISMQVFQVNFALRNTLLSEKYFSNTFDKYGMSKTLSEIMVNKMNNIKPKEDKQKSDKENSGDEFTAVIFKHIDKNWYETQMPMLIKGAQSYIVGDAEKLPVLDVKSLKQGLTDGTIDELIKNEEVQNKIVQVKRLLGKIERTKADSRNVSNDVIINRVMYNNEVKKLGITKDKLQALIKLYEEKNNKDIDKELVKILFNGNVNFSTIKDTLDLNDAANSMTDNGTNPIKYTREIVTSYKNLTSNTLLILITLLVLLILIIDFKVYHFLKLLTRTLISSGIVGLILVAIGMISLTSKNVAVNLTKKLTNEQQIDSLILMGKLLFPTITCINY